MTSTRTSTVIVLTPTQGVENAIVLVDQLIAAGAISNGNGNSLNAKLQAAVRSLERGNTSAAAGQLGAVLNEIDAMVASGRLSVAEAAALRSLVARVIASIE